MDELPRYDAATLASLQAHLVTMSMLTTLHEAWDKASDDGKRVLADRILVWAGSHLTELRVESLVHFVLRQLIDDGAFRKFISSEHEEAVLHAFVGRVVSELKDRTWSDRGVVREALVRVARDRFADVASELAVVAMAGDSERQ